MTRGSMFQSSQKCWFFSSKFVYVALCMYVRTPVRVLTHVHMCDEQPR